jgi:protein-L-isoaspartate(D-aspartate) O-methyltransferase
MKDYSFWTRKLLNQIKAGGHDISSEVERAFLHTPRHLLLGSFYKFVAEGVQRIEYDPKGPKETDLSLIYSDSSFATVVKNGNVLSSTSQPSLMAIMLEALELRNGLKVLEIGTGIGYNAALIYEIVGRNQVTSIDVLPELIEQTGKLLIGAGYTGIKLKAGDGYFGDLENSPYDRIVATVGCPDISPCWVEQLKPSGILLVPLTHSGWQPLVKLRKEDNVISGKVVSYSGFLPIAGTLAEDNVGFFKEIQLPSNKYRKVKLPSQIENAHDAINMWATAFPTAFYFFLSIRDHRTFWSLKPRGYGLHDELRGTLIVEPQSRAMFLCGEESLVDDLRSYYEEWLALGKPEPSRYRIELRPREANARRKRNTLGVIRKYYEEIVSLS